MDFVTDFSANAPRALQVLVYFAVGIAAITSIMTNLRKSRRPAGIFALMAKELSTNAGSSIKDRVKFAAEESAIAVAQNVRIEQKIDEQNKRMAAGDEKFDLLMTMAHESAKDRVSLHEKFDLLKSRFDGLEKSHGMENTNEHHDHRG